MRRNEPASASLPSVSRAVQIPATESLWAVNQRLANAERELRVQFTRIAQLQAQLDLLLGALRRSPTESPCNRRQVDFASLNFERKDEVVSPAQPVRLHPRQRSV